VAVTLAAAPAHAGIWLDTSTPLTSAVADTVVRFGAVGIMRYVPLPGNDAAADISAAELELLCGKGLQVLLVQHCRLGPWTASAERGMGDGSVAAGFAVRCGYPRGAHLYVDLEDMAATDEAAAIHANAWGAAVVGAGFAFGVYHGFSVPLSAEQLYHELIADSYWTDMAVRPVAVRGNAIVQGPPLTLGGVQFDRNTLAADKLGQVPIACGALGMVA
jgi:hypothetical protein